MSEQLTGGRKRLYECKAKEKATELQRVKEMLHTKSSDFHLMPWRYNDTVIVTVCWRLSLSFNNSLWNSALYFQPLIWPAPFLRMWYSTAICKLPLAKTDWAYLWMTSQPVRSCLNWMEKREDIRERAGYLRARACAGLGLAFAEHAGGPPLFLATEGYNCCLVRPGDHSVCHVLFSWVWYEVVCVSVSVSDYIMVPAFVDAANERVCLRHCALFQSGYRDAPVTELHGNRKWAGHLAHQWWGIPLASWHSGWLFDVPIGC